MEVLGLRLKENTVIIHIKLYTKKNSAKHMTNDRRKRFARVDGLAVPWSAVHRSCGDMDDIKMYDLYG
jgi:hypothetical protein